ncbi:MAG: hypothetical protein OEN50_13915, partial [Deltaproteobacteria bacterium]|nr:hypothetical protein [Deltaproteobacteria bacterium]
MYLVNHRFALKLSCTVLFSIMLIVGWAIAPAQAHCGGNHTGNHSHCAGNPPSGTPNAPFIYAKSTNIYVTDTSGSGSTQVFSGVSGFAAPSWTADGNGFLISGLDGIYFQA